MKKLLKFFKDEEGIEIVEWALMCALFALGCGVAIGALSTDVSTFFGSIGTYLTDYRFQLRFRGDIFTINSNISD
jgi:Flp pilus assembly pilin Flp